MRLAIVNDYEVIVAGLTAMLAPYRQVVDIVELDANASVHKAVDIALYDTFAAPQGNGPEVRELVANPLVSKVVVYSWNGDRALVDAALANGASGYLCKGASADRMIEVLRAVQRGERCVERGVADGAGADECWPGGDAGLTLREAEVLALITQGLSNAEIAERAHLSINSVKTYIRSCYRRIGVTSRSQAVLWGIGHGFGPDRTRLHPHRADDWRRIIDVEEQGAGRG